jgi:hypothetical protein
MALFFKFLCFCFAWMSGASGGGLHRRGRGLARAGLAARPASPRRLGLRRGLLGGVQLQLQLQVRSTLEFEVQSPSQSTGVKAQPEFDFEVQVQTQSPPSWTSKSKSKPKVRQQIGLGLQVQVQLLPEWTSKAKSKPIGFRALPWSMHLLARKPSPPCSKQQSSYSVRVPSQTPYFQRNGPVVANPCKGIDQWQLTNPAKGEFASKKCSKMF